MDDTSPSSSKDVPPLLEDVSEAKKTELKEDFKQLDEIIDKNTKNLSNNDILDEDDLILIAENTGVKIDSVQKGRRRRILIEDSDDESESPPSKAFKDEKSDKKQDIKSKLPGRGLKTNELDDIADFIVDDNFEEDDKFQATFGEKLKSHPTYSRATREADSIFGEDFNYDDLATDTIVEESDIEHPAKIDGIFEPAELKHTFRTTRDIEIQLSDIPERMQRRSKPVESFEDENEADEETVWIHRNIFSQDHFFSVNQDKDFLKSASPTILKQKIIDILKLIRTEKLEVPFIAKYRKEIYQPELSLPDLWSIYDADTDWMYFKERSKNLIKLLTQVQKLQKYFEKHPEIKTISLGPTVDDQEFEKIKKIENNDSLNDYYEYFSFYHLKPLKSIQLKISELIPPEDLENLTISNLPERKLPENIDHYSFFSRIGLRSLVALLGLSARELGENFQQKYPVNAPRKKINDPLKVASTFVSKFSSTPESALNNAVKMWALELANDPLVRGFARTFFFKNAKISCKPSPKGAIEIDEQHPYIEFKYLRQKPVSMFKPENFLKLIAAESEGVISLNFEAITEDGLSITDQCKPFFEVDEYGTITQEWNQLRRHGVIMCFNKLFKVFEKDLKSLLINEAQKSIINMSLPFLSQHLDVTGDSSKTGIVFGISLPHFSRQSSKNFGTCAVVTNDGSFLEGFSLDSVLSLRPSSLDTKLVQRRRQALDCLARKICDHKPSAVVLNIERRETVDLLQDLQGSALNMYIQNHDMPIIEAVNSIIPCLAAKSRNYATEFPTHDLCGRQAISVARYSIDPMLETSQIFSDPDDIVSLPLHPLLKQISKEVVFHAFERLLIEIVNTIGVNLNRCLTDQRYSYLLQYIAGLGPSKAAFLLSTLKASEMIKTRAELITVLNFGPKVFVNSAGFLQIPSNIEYDDDIEPFDNTRIHPESYDLARDVLSVVADISSFDQTGIVDAMLKVLEDAEPLCNRDINEIAASCSITNASKHIPTLEDIRVELREPFVDKRKPYQPLNDNQIFWIILTNGLFISEDCLNAPNSPVSYDSQIPVTIVGIAFRKPSKNDIRDIQLRKDDVGNYLCPFCKSTSKETSEFWDHLENNCRGTPIGVRVRLENGISGFVKKDQAGDNFVDKLGPGMVVNAKILTVNDKQFSIDFSLKNPGLLYLGSEKGRDPFFDTEKEKADVFKQTEQKERIKNRVVYHKRLIVHPLFKNVSFEEAQSILETEDMDCIFRPSSKGLDHLGLTLRITEGVICHVDIREEQKPNHFSLGKKLYIGEQCFEDLDEIYARFVSPYLSFIKSALSHKSYFPAFESDRINIEAELKKRHDPSTRRIPYLFSTSKTYPGKIFIAYMPKNIVKYEYISVNNLGFRIDNRIFKTIDSVISWFKTNRREGMFPNDTTKSFTPRYDSFMPGYSAYSSINAVQGNQSTNSFQSPLDPDWDE